ncbi:MAG: hypothetical protein IKJ35_04425 [Clostridia bacterium]|nr:hypothetical protein [Clostridia bacterium]
MTHVTTKKELQQAIKRKDSEIMVSGKLAKKMKGFAKLKKLSKKKLAALLTFATGSGAVAVAAITAAAPTGGVSVAGATVSFILAAPAAGVSTGSAIVLIALLGAIGLSVIALLKDYDFEVKAGDNLYFKAKKSTSKDE